jgi:signal transduction histidine kinase
MGTVNICAMLGTYFIATRYTEEPEIVAIIVIAVTGIIFVISQSVTSGFERLAQANKMKTEFVSIASHQLRTPLAAIRWTLNLLTDGRLGQMTPEQNNYIGLIKEGNERMVRLVNDLLDVSRIEMGKMVLVPRQTNLYILIKKTLDGFALFAQSHNITLSMDAPETLPNVLTDPEKINLVIQNLVDNAIKYTKEKGEIKITMSQEKGFLKTAVKDTGVGIPKKQQKFIFQKFFRSDNALKNQTMGTGLGLFIAKSVVEESKGKIWFESEPEKGTTFFFTLPIYK